MSKIINQEYVMADKTTYLRLDCEHGGEDEPNISIIETTGGVAMYEGDELISKFVSKSLNITKNDDTVTLEISDDIAEALNSALEEGTGIKISDKVVDNKKKKEISLDEDFLKRFIVDTTAATYKSRNGVLITQEDDTKWIELDDNYVINQGKY